MDKKSADPGTRAQRLPAIRTLLMWLSLACMVPSMAGVVVLFLKDVQAGRQQLEQSSIQTAHALGLALDQKFAQIETAALMLSQDPHLQANNLALFHRHAIAALARVEISGNVVVSNVQGQQVLNTLVDLGTALPVYRNQEQLHQVLATGRPVGSATFVL